MRRGIVFGRIIIGIAMGSVMIILAACGGETLADRERFVSPADPAWLYANGTWTEADPEIGEAMVGQRVPRDGEWRELPIYADRTGWHTIEVAFSGAVNEDNFARYVSRDGVHPSEEGHRFLAEQYAQTISMAIRQREAAK